MNPFLQVCIVLVTAALVVLAIAAIRAMIQFERAAREVGETADAMQRMLEDASRTSSEVRELVVSLESVSNSLRGAAAKLGAVGDRAAAVSSVVLDEVEAPVRKAAALVRGFRAGAAMLTERWTASRRTAPAPTNGGNRHE